ncbi:MAG: hypothetical protein WKF58_15015 [Ilumatobacteraceae bacterium]
MADVEVNADPVTAAPPTLRATGFDIVADERLDRLTTHLDEHQARANALGTAAAPLLNTEDLMKGHRLEVWDDTTAAWYSLHLRSNDLDLAGTDTFHVDHEAGFIQGATASKTPEEAVAPGTTPKTYLHESLFGWSGWSLSAPHPAMRPEFVYEPDDTDGSHPTRREHVGDAEPPDDPANQRRQPSACRPWHAAAPALRPLVRLPCVGSRHRRQLRPPRRHRRPCRAGIGSHRHLFSRRLRTSEGGGGERDPADEPPRRAERAGDVPRHRAARRGEAPRRDQLGGRRQRWTPTPSVSSPTGPSPPPEHTERPPSCNRC